MGGRGPPAAYSVCNDHPTRCDFHRPRRARSDARRGARPLAQSRRHAWWLAELRRHARLHQGQLRARAAPPAPTSPPAKAAIQSLGTTVAGECPLAAVDSPQNHEAEQLSNEVVGALEVAAYQPDKESMLAFAHAIRGLRWSNRKLTRAVGAYATKLEGFPTLAPPDICADVKAWAASGYSTLPASTVSFDKGFYAYSIEAEEVPLRLLRPYESATEASLLRRTQQLEAPLAEFEAEAVSDYSEILDSLKLPQ